MRASWKVNPLIRYDFPAAEVTLTRPWDWVVGKLSAIIVLSPAVPATESVVVCPINVIALVITRELVQLAFPAGIITVSPSPAEPMALLTSKSEGVRAVMLFACAAPEAAKRSAARSALTFPTVALQAEAGWPDSPQGIA